MSASTRSRALEFAALLFAFVVAATSYAQPAPSAFATAALPDPVRALVPGLEIQGEGSLRWFGLLVYHSRLWAPAAGWRADAPYALEIRYARSIKGAQLASTSIDEMRHTQTGTDAQHQQWRDAMAKTFPDVKDGDTLVGIFAPGAATRFFLNGKPVGDIADSAFGPAFFGIWLAPGTSRPELRRMLLGQSK